MSLSLLLSARHQRTERASDHALLSELAVQAVGRLCGPDALDAAEAFAAEVNLPEVWAKLGREQLEQSDLQKAMASFIKARDVGPYAAVLKAAHHAGSYHDLLDYLRMVREEIESGKKGEGTEFPSIVQVHSELIYILVKTSKLSKLEEMLAGPNDGDIVEMGRLGLGIGVWS